MVLLVKKYYLLNLFLGLIAIFLFLNYFINKSITVMALPTSNKVVFIDAGHGGIDPGKVGENGAHEKEINLLIAKKLQSYLENSGAKVYMTRITDEGLYSQNDKNKKRADMKNRKQLINSSGADILISIHQNSFTQSKYKGAQVFYHESSVEGKRLAEFIQKELREFVESSNKRQPKENNTYYILKQVNIPAVIVECGFLSNIEDEKNLNNDLYQQKISWAIYVAILKYFGELE